MKIKFTRAGMTELETEAFEFLNLLAHAQLEELDIGSICGGHGLCGADRVLIPAGCRKHLSPLTKAENRLLSPDQISTGYRLGCQTWPEPEKKLEEDLEIQVEVQI